MIMPAWSLVAGGHIPEADAEAGALAATSLRDRLAAVLADASYNTLMSSLHIDTDRPVRAAPHAPAAR